jgi:O-antigen/teichoic acid export membrane protein
MAGNMIARNVGWNLFGTGAPVLVAVVTIPILARELGTDRFGVLNLAWMLIGYFTLFDLGLGRALTRVVADRLGAGRQDEIPVLFWTSLLLMLGLGLLGSVAGAGASAWLVSSALKVPVELRQETFRAFLLLAVSLPVTITTIGLQGTLQAYQRFRVASILRVVMGLFTFLAPVGMLPFSHSLMAIVGALLAGRVVAWLAHLLVCLRVIPALRSDILVRRSVVGPLLRVGGWMTVSNVISPLMVTFDRFLLGSLVSISAVTYYATPFDVVTKLFIIPAALSGVLFPAFASSFAEDSSKARRIYDRSVKYTAVVMFPIVLVVVAFAREGLQIWLGAAFADQGTKVLQWLAIGVFLNSVAHVPFAFIQGAGRPDLTAKFHLAELPVYLLAIWWLVGHFGLVGAAVAWTMRVGVDMLLLFRATDCLVPEKTVSGRQGSLALAGALLALIVGTWPVEVAMKFAFLLLTFGIFSSVVWFSILVPYERPVLLRVSKSFLSFARDRGKLAAR